jgi:hypothetical protein
VHDLTMPASGQTAPITPEPSVATAETEVNYEELTKVDLQALAAQRGVGVSSSDTKAEIIEALEEAEEESAVEEPSE